MVARVAVLICVAACSFQHGSQTGDALSGDAARNVDAELSVDAKVFLDAAPHLDAPAPPPTGSLVVTPAVVSAGDLDLTTEGTLDWAHWGYLGATSFDHEIGGNSISDVTVVGAAMRLAVSNVSTTASWTNGTPDGSVSQTGTGTGVQSPGGLRFTVPAGTTPHVLRVYVGGKNSIGRLDATLSDNSATSYTNSQSAGTSALHVQYAIAYNASSNGQTLTVTWTDTGDGGGGGFEMLLSATLQ